MNDRSKIPLELFYDFNNKYEIGIDECGRGPLFGRCYVAACIFPKSFSNENDRIYAEKNIKDSKKITSKIKMKEIANFIERVAIAYHITYIEHDEIDRINILHSVYKGMHECITKLMHFINNKNDVFLLIDGDKFKPYTYFDEKTQIIKDIPFETIIGGDNKYMGIAAASILGKVRHDEYIYELCSKYPILQDRYDLIHNVGYGTAKHIAGIKEHGICQFHRKTFGIICKNAKINPINIVV